MCCSKCSLAPTNKETLCFSDRGEFNALFVLMVIIDRKAIILQQPTPVKVMPSVQSKREVIIAPADDAKRKVCFCFT
jgi:hypothetical protein